MLCWVYFVIHESNAKIIAPLLSFDKSDDQVLNRFIFSPLIYKFKFNLFLIKSGSGLRLEIEERFKIKHTVKSTFYSKW